jgi:hypothetical protein
MPIRWAIAETLAPGSDASATAHPTSAGAIAVEHPQVARRCARETTHTFFTPFLSEHLTSSRRQA